MHKSLLGFHADTSSGARGLKFCSSLSLLPYFPWHLGNESTKQSTLHYWANPLDYSTHRTVHKCLLGSHADVSSEGRGLNFCSSLSLLPFFPWHLGIESTQESILHYWASQLEFSTHRTVHKCLLGSHADTSSGTRRLKFCPSLSLLPHFPWQLGNEPDTMVQPNF